VVCRLSLLFIYFCCELHELLKFTIFHLLLGNMKNIELGKDEILEKTSLKRQTLKNMIVGEKNSKSE
jgi:hypothetical protein